jgi:hypothetical protein
MPANAEGLSFAEAAVELLIGHRRWLGREDFAGRFVAVDTDTNIVLVARAVLHAHGHRAAVVTVGGLERRWLRW